MRVSNTWQKWHFGANYPFKTSRLNQNQMLIKQYLIKSMKWAQWPGLNTVQSGYSSTCNTLVLCVQEIHLNRKQSHDSASASRLTVLSFTQVFNTFSVSHWQMQMSRCTTEAALILTNYQSQCKTHFRKITPFLVYCLPTFMDFFFYLFFLNLPVRFKMGTSTVRI